MSEGRMSGGGREVVTVFPSEESFSGALDALQSSGVDRARISVLATGTTKAGDTLLAAGFRTVGDVLDAQGVPRTSYVEPEDVGASKGLAISGLVYLGATLGAGLAAAAMGPLLAPIVAAAAASGAAGGGVGAFLARRLGRSQSRYIEQSLAHGGLVVWVATGLTDDEAHVIAVLEANGGRDVHTHDHYEPEDLT